MVLESTILFFLVGIVLVGVGVSLAQLLSPKSENKSKFEAYECGIEMMAAGGSRFDFARFGIEVYRAALHVRKLCFME